MHIEEEVLRPQRLGAGLGGGPEGVADLQPAAPGRHGLGGGGGGGGGLPGIYRVSKKKLGSQNFQIAITHSFLKLKSIVIPLNQMSQRGEKHAQD